jgi:hypothetical protein
LQFPLAATDYTGPALMASEGYHPCAQGFATSTRILVDAGTSFLAPPSLVLRTSCR